MNETTTKLPSYIHTDCGRAFLTLGADITGTWNAAYLHYHKGPDDNDYGVVSSPVVNDCVSPQVALEMLRREMKRSHLL